MKSFWINGMVFTFCASFFFILIQLPVFAESIEDIKQPINFSHKTHAGDNNVACEFCHSSARKSSISGVPPVKTCVGCHNVIKGTTPEQQKEITKVIGYWKRKEPIPWKKAHDLPDFVYFSHKRHIKAGFDCTNCHGDVSKVKQPLPMEKFGEIPQSMGWCMTCHKMEHPTIDGKIYQANRITRGNTKSTPAEGKPNGKMIGPKDCLTCHK